MGVEGSEFRVVLAVESRFLAKVGGYQQPSVFGNSEATPSLWRVGAIS